MEIRIDREEKELIDTNYRIAVERVIRKFGIFRGENKKHGSFRDISKGVLGLDEERYEIPNEGIIIYQSFIVTNGKYIATIKLEGFNEKESRVFSELKNNLEEILNTKTGKEVADKFLL